VIGIGATVAVAAPAAPAGEWKAGVATVLINPELPMWMSGYGRRTAPAQEIAADLKAKALALEHRSGQRLVIVTTDLLGIPRNLRDAVGSRVARQFALPDEALILNASHTHCGPELRAVDTVLGRAEAARAGRVASYQSELEARLASVVGEALSRLAPARLAYSRAHAGFAMNRRPNHQLHPGNPRYGKVPNPDGPVDHDVPVLIATGADGGTLAVLFGYACHNTTSNESVFHGDYAGFAQQALEGTLPGTTALFLSGCGGDQNPYPRRSAHAGRSGIELAKLHGQTLALAVESALDAPRMELAGDLRVALATVDLPYLPAPSRSELETRASSANRQVREYAQALLELLEKDGGLPRSYPYPVQVVQFGTQLTLVALASEVVVDFSLRLKRELPGGAVWVSAYNNDFMGYIPSRRVWEEGGYEGGGALTYTSQTLYRALHPAMWDPVVEELIVARVHALVRSLRAAPEGRP
jgi:neutral ceramidase